MKIPFVKLTDKAATPSQAHDFDAAYDLYATENYTLQIGERRLFPTNIACRIPKGYYGRIAPRSGLAYKHGIDILGGVVDHSYSGDISVIMINLGQHSYEVKAGDRIAQFIIETCAQVEREEVTELEETSRGEGAWGSSGV